MAKNGPNKGAAKAIARRPFDQERQSAKDEARAERQADDPLLQFIFAQSRAGITYKDLAEAEAAFKST
jgi:hypothetical protein